MIKSMTGFGRSVLGEDGKKASVEIKSVNHRYLDLGLKMPRRFNAIEADIRNILKKNIVRGKVDVYISYEDISEAAVELKYNKALAGAYIKYFKEIESDFGLEPDAEISPYALARFPEVITMPDESEDDEGAQKIVIRAIEKALEGYDAAKIKEGEALKEDLLQKLDFMLENVIMVEERYPEIMEQHEEKLRARLNEVLESVQVDESRIAAEMVIYADKICTDEETVRLKSHIEAMKQALKSGGEAGRKLDFMAQEMNREANTLLSKANDFKTSQIGIDLKTTIEKIREQIQNIE